MNAAQTSTDDLFSRKSDEYNFFRNDNLDPTKQRLSHIAMLLEKLVSINLIIFIIWTSKVARMPRYQKFLLIFLFILKSTCAVKNEDDALLAHEVAQKLIKSLVDYKMKTVHPQHSKSVKRYKQFALS